MLLEKERVRIKSLKKMYGQLFSKYFSKIFGSQEDNQISIFGCPHSFFGRRGHADFATLKYKNKNVSHVIRYCECMLYEINLGFFKMYVASFQNTGDKTYKMVNLT